MQCVVVQELGVCTVRTGLMVFLCFSTGDFTTTTSKPFLRGRLWAIRSCRPCECLCVRWSSHNTARLSVMGRTLARKQAMVPLLTMIFIIITHCIRTGVFQGHVLKHHGLTIKIRVKHSLTIAKKQGVTRLNIIAYPALYNL